MTPTVTETPTATIAASKEDAVGKPARAMAVMAKALPTGMPMTRPPGKNHGLDQELGQDVGRVGADGDPQPDLAGPLGDGDEHDVHDAHPGHRQGNEATAMPRPDNQPTSRLKMLETLALS